MILNPEGRARHEVLPGIARRREEFRGKSFDQTVDPVSRESHMRNVQANVDLKSRIHPIADAKDRQRRFEEDGLILVRMADLKF